MTSSGKIKSPEESRLERERYNRRKTLEVKYKQRFTIAKEGKSALTRRDLRMMVYRYNEYLKIMAETFEVATIYDIKPEHFDVKKDVAELLLISQIYWELAKLYDNSSKSTDKLTLCLNQFVCFTLNMPFQGLNSEIVRKEIKKRKFRNKQLFSSILDGIYRETSRCYIATHYECDQATLEILRKWKKNGLSKNILGQQFIAFYYEISPVLVSYLRKNPKYSKCLSVMIKPLLQLLTLFLRRT